MCKKILDHAKGEVWICDADYEKNARIPEMQYRVTSKQYTNSGMQLMVIIEEKPHAIRIYRPCEDILEDAYIWMSNSYADIF